VTALIYAMPGNATFAGRLCAAWPADRGELSVRRFPDGESLVRLDTAPGGRAVAIVCTLHEPDAQILPLLFAAAAAREQGARCVGLVAPYLAYMRQDTRFHPGEARSAVHFARLLSAHFDWLVTMDPHLHRFHALDEIYTMPTATVAAAPLLAQWIAANVDKPVLIGPDVESRQWVGAVARAADAPWQVLQKVRSGDRTVSIGVPDLKRWQGHTPVLVDDIISSGGTLMELTRELRAQGLAAPVCVAVHGVFAPSAYWSLLEAGAGRIVTTNTIEHATSAIDVSGPIAAACARLVPLRLPDVAAPVSARSDVPVATDTPPESRASTAVAR
jgi:ribose-phosphate pyrophosphokinase